jgi:uncharacterized protein YybS (DUF2232 family)
MMIVLAAVFVTVLMGVQGGFYYIYEFGVLNAFLILVLRRESEFVDVVFKSSLFAFITIAVVVGSLTAIYNINVHDAIGAVIDSNIDKVIELYNSVDMPAEQVEQLKGIYLNLKGLLKKIYPAMIFIGFEVIIASNLFVINRFFLKKEQKVDTEGLLKWMPNERWVFGLILFGFLFFVKNSAVNMAALNGLIVFLALYFFSGFCIMNYFFKAKNIPVFVQGLIYFGFLLMSELKYIIIAFGVFDVWLDFRKIRGSVS